MLRFDDNGFDALLGRLDPDFDNGTDESRRFSRFPIKVLAECPDTFRLMSAKHADRFEPLPPKIAEIWSFFPHWEGRTFLVNVLGIEVEELRSDYARMTMPFKEGNLQADGLTHGGAIASLIDTVVVPAIGSGAPKGATWSTIELHTQYHRPLLTDAIAEGWVVKRGRSVVFTRAEVYDTEGRHVASGTATYMVKSD